LHTFGLLIKLLGIFGFFEAQQQNVTQFHFFPPTVDFESNLNASVAKRKIVA
jgi:hypothetical protein